MIIRQSTVNIIIIIIPVYDMLQQYICMLHCMYVRMYVRMYVCMMVEWADQSKNRGLL